MQNYNYKVGDTLDTEKSLPKDTLLININDNTIVKVSQNFNPKVYSGNNSDFYIVSEIVIYDEARQKDGIIKSFYFDNWRIHSLPYEKKQSEISPDILAPVGDAIYDL